MHCTRRQWLGTATGVYAAAAVRMARAAAPANITLGFSLYGMKSLSTAQGMKTCADIGYSGIELPLMPDWPCDPAKCSRMERKDIQTRLAELSLDLPSLMENLPLVVSDEQHQANLERLKLAAALAHDLVPNAPPIIETVLGGKPDQWNEVKQQMVDALGDWKRVAAAGKTVIAIKAHAFNTLHTPEDAVWLVKQIDSPWIKLAFDYSHFERQQLALPDCLRIMLPDSVFVHVKDNLTTDGKTEFALPGEGPTNYGEYISLLKTGGYRGAVMVEVSAQVSSKAGYNPVVAAERSYLNLRPAFERAGLRARI